MTNREAGSDSGVPSGKPAEPREMTFKAVALGLFLGISFRGGKCLPWDEGRTNGSRHSSRGRHCHGAVSHPCDAWHVLEQNIARTAASVGEALVAGAIFTIPAFVMAESSDRSSIPLLGSNPDTPVRRARSASSSSFCCASPWSWMRSCLGPKASRLPTS